MQCSTVLCNVMSYHVVSCHAIPVLAPFRAWLVLIMPLTVDIHQHFSWLGHGVN